jgi:hypothetical protein
MKDRILNVILVTGIVAIVCCGFDVHRHLGTFIRDGVTYVQRGGLGAADYVVTNVDTTAIKAHADAATNALVRALTIDRYDDASLHVSYAKESRHTEDADYASRAGTADKAILAVDSENTAALWSAGRKEQRIVEEVFDQLDAATRMNATQSVALAEHETAIQTVTDDNLQTRQIVTTWENFLDGSNVVFSITNYISGTYNLSAAKLRILEMRDGSYREVYNSRDEILLHMNDFKDGDFTKATNHLVGVVNSAVESKADKNWGKYTSAGGIAPENTVYMTAPNTVFAGGLEYERVAVGEGAICVLTTKGAPVWTQGDEGTFKFQDGGGTNYFGFAKTDSYTIGANTDGITVQNGMVTMNYNITMSGRPCVWYKADLTSNTEWEQLNLPDGSPVAGASHIVTWDENPPADSQVCYINVGNKPSGFFRASVEVAGSAKFMTNMPADFEKGIICPNTATGEDGVIKPRFNGSVVEWVWSKQ